MTEEEIIEAIAQRVRTFLGRDFRLYLFGSRASGKADRYADFDLMVWGPEAISEETFLEIKNSIDSLETLHKIDLVDYHRVSTEFRNVILEKAKEILDGKVGT